MARYSGSAGILAGLALIGEFTFFMASGFTPQIFADPSSALPFLEERGGFLRIAVLFGAAGVALRMLFVVGLAHRFEDRVPMRAAGVLYFAILGSVGHGLVALTFWIGIPGLVEIAGRDSQAAASAWAPFSLITSGFEGFGNALLALSMLAAGAAVLGTRLLPAGVGWVAILAGLATVVRIVTTGTPVAALGFAAYFPSLVLAVVFLIWAGVALRGAAGLGEGKGRVRDVVAGV